MDDSNPLLPLENDAAVISAALAQPEVEAASRRIITGGLTTSREGAFPVSIAGIEPEKEQPVSLTAQNVIEGRYLTTPMTGTWFSSAKAWLTPWV